MYELLRFHAPGVPNQTLSWRIRKRPEGETLGAMVTRHEREGVGSEDTPYDVNIAVNCRVYAVRRMRYAHGEFILCYYTGMGATAERPQVLCIFPRAYLAFNDRGMGHGDFVEYASAETQADNQLMVEVLLKRLAVGLPQMRTLRMTPVDMRLSPKIGLIGARKQRK